MKILVLIFLILLLGTYLWRKRKESIYILCVTFLTLSFTASCYTIVIVFKDLDFSVGWIGGTFMFALVILSFQILVSVIFFKYFLKKYIAFKNQFLRYSVQFLLMLFIAQGGLICWAMLDMQFFDFNYEYTFRNILKSYKENYLDFAVVSFLIPVTIICLSKWYYKHKDGIVAGNEISFEK